MGEVVEMVVLWEVGGFVVVVGEGEEEGDHDEGDKEEELRVRLALGLTVTFEAAGLLAGAFVAALAAVVGGGSEIAEAVVGPRFKGAPAAAQTCWAKLRVSVLSSHGG